MAETPASPASLSWLADLFPAADGDPASTSREPTSSFAAVTRRLSGRRELARQRGRGEALGVDLAHAAINALVARGALPELATLHIVAPRDSDLAVAVTAGIAGACRAHDIPVMVPLAAHGDGEEQIGLVLSGRVLAPPVAVPEPGQVVLALVANGPNEADFAALMAAARQHGRGLDDRFAGGDPLAALLLAAQKSQFSVLQAPLRERWPVRLLAVDDGSVAATLQAALPAGVAVDWNFDDFAPPEPFRTWYPGREGAAHAARTTSFGCSMLAVAPVALAERLRQLCAAWNEPAMPIARLRG